MTNNSLSEDIYAVGQLMADNLNTVGVSDADVDDGLTTLANKILEASPVEKVNTILTLDTPMLVYTDLFTVTGTLTDDEETPIAEATVQLIWNDGTEHIATGATNSNGVFSFTSTDPASVSSYSFQLFFAGDNDYNASNSSVVNVNTAKETSVMDITSPASGSTVSTDNVTLSGTLEDNDGTAMSGKSVSFSLNSSSAGTATVESDGTFSKTITGLAAGSNSIVASFAATTTHTAASQSITVNRSTFDGLSDLSLIAGSQILSYADEQSTPNSQYATLETQLMNGESAAAISGVSVGFYDYSDENNPVLLGSDDTDSTGKASFTYHSTGVGDVPVKAKVGSILTKTFSIIDGWFYDDATSNAKSSKYGSIIPLEKSTANGTFSYDTTNNCWKVRAGALSVDGLPILPLADKSDFKLTVDLMVTGTSATSGGLFVGQYNQGLDYQMANGGAYNYLKHNYGGSNTVLQASGGVFNDWFTLELTYTNGTVTARYLQGNTVILTDTSNISYTPTTFGISFGYTASGNPVYFKNVRVEPL